MTRAADKRGSYWRGKARPENRRPTTAASTSVRELFEAVDATAMTYKTLAAAGGNNEYSLTKWRYGITSPRLADFEAIAQVLGYRVALVPIESETAVDSGL
jgi:hypothetical protein